MATDKMQLLLTSEKLFDVGIKGIKHRFKETQKTKCESNKRPGPMKRNGVGKRARTYPYSNPWKSNDTEEIVKHSSEYQLHLPSNVVEDKNYKTPSPATSFPDLTKAEKLIVQRSLGSPPFTLNGTDISKRTRTRSNGVREASTRRCRTPSPTFGQGDVCEMKPLKPISRRPPSPPVDHSRPVSPKRTRTRSRSPNYRSPSPLRRSPHGSIDQLHIEAVKKRIQKLQTYRLYLLRKRGPHSFTVGSAENEHTYIVTIGPQTCSCSSQQTHCIHLLFIMLKVLKVSENQQCIFSKNLKNYEVESLVRKYEERRLSRVSLGLKQESLSPDSTTQVESETPTKELKEAVEVVEEKNACTICLNLMTDNEKLVTCGECRNDFHNDCLEIWLKNCRRQKETTECPLCRKVWKDNSPSYPVQNHVISSSVSEPKSHYWSFPTGPTRIPLCRSFRERSNSIESWSETFGQRLVLELTSGSWSIRETKLKDVIDQAEMLMCQLINEENSFNVTETQPWIRVVKTFAEILQVMAQDPVFRVYTMSWYGLTTLLANYMCIGEEDAVFVQELIRPIVRVILTKCADGCPKTSKESMQMITTLSCGQSGEAAVGRDTGCPAQEDVTGFVYILSCIFESEREDADSTYSAWQRTLGRLYALDQLMSDFPREFNLLQVHNNTNKENRLPNHRSKPLQPKLLNHNRIRAILGYSLKFLKNNHVNIRKMAERLFIRATRLSDHVPKVYSSARQMLARVDSSLLDRLRDKTPSRDCSIGSNVETVLYTSVRMPDRRHSLGRTSLPSSPVRGGRYSPSVGPRCSTPVNATRRASLPSLRRSLSSGSNAPPFSTKPQRPNYLPLPVSGRLSLDSCGYPPSYVAAGPAPRRCGSAGYENTACCFNHVCHVHASPCDRKCITKRRKTPKSPPNVPPNTPQCPVGDLIDLSGTENFRSVAFQMSASLLDAIPETQSAKNMALNSGKSHSSFYQSIKSPNCSLGPLSKSFNSNSIGAASAYIEGVHWVRSEVLGNGGFSTCYLGRDIQTGRLMAVKQVSFHSCNPDEQEKRRIAVRDEILMMMKLDHPNIVRLLGACENENNYDLFVEWMPGGSVATSLKNFGAFSDHVIVSYLTHVLSGLEYLHDNRILHRDLKGANLLIDSTGYHLRIADFGAAKKLLSHTTLPGECRGEMLGTIAFMAPEVLRGEGYGRACDVWSVGCCVIEMVTTKPPWNAHEFTNDNALLYRIAASQGPPPIPEFMSALIKDFALWCLQPISSSRPTVKQLKTHACFND